MKHPLPLSSYGAYMQQLVQEDIDQPMDLQHLSMQVEAAEFQEWLDSLEASQPGVTHPLVDYASSPMGSPAKTSAEDEGSIEQDHGYKHDVDNDEDHSRDVVSLSLTDPNSQCPEMTQGKVGAAKTGDESRKTITSEIPDNDDDLFGDNNGEGEGEGEGESEDDSGEDSGCQPHGPLPNDLKQLLDAYHSEYGCGIHQLAEKWKIVPKAFFSYVDPDAYIPHDPNHWNIFQHWYVALSEWTKVVHSEFHAFLKSKLSEEKLNNHNVHEEALNEQILWFNSILESYIECKKKKGKIGKTLLKILHLVIAMAHKINRETGYEIGGYAVHPELKSVAWVGMDLLEAVKANHSTQMFMQASQIAVLVQ
ncbi:hypothetical protein GYMLUDRAFT_240983 [Collybiopsis luxurians FD-317 M1]|nr:hypothetical protein GYMLUDRAFT_240983 [Collybiopsis luxurians FD-317 M1]